jgi:hypothetical protein
MGEAYDSIHPGSGSSAQLRALEKELGSQRSILKAVASPMALGFEAAYILR